MAMSIDAQGVIIIQASITHKSAGVLQNDMSVVKG